MLIPLRLKKNLEKKKKKERKEERNVIQLCIGCNSKDLAQKTFG